MTHPPDDRSFPGRPGGPAFPGAPGTPAPSGAPGPPAVAGPPPGPGTGRPGGPHPPRRPGRVRAVAAASTAAALAAGLLGFAVWENTAGRPYTALPPCRDLLPSEALDTAPGTDAVPAGGGYVPVEEQEWLAQDPGLAGTGYLGMLSCSLKDPDTVLVVEVSVSLYDHGLYRESFEEEAADLAGRLEDWEQGRDTEAGDRVVFEPSGVGDAGATVLFAADPAVQVLPRSGTSVFQDVNTHTHIGFSLPSDWEDGRTAEFMNEFADTLQRRLARTAERL
ncbi:hypothetical protein SAMN05421803_10787 [Nocardiopsis flavescens]|uniref:Uncharacterized protein n=1 Tax=Nocardiopsis flavescens TaxID=758803 RepID=A0A1M6K975_9ACTN|nr:hypothetical protein [Nocardiopsis flavescens]SHJ55521.1 hypothetical protein SAMN05421803_10787 [Nocardiopsis flavescens]